MAAIGSGTVKVSRSRSRDTATSLVNGQPARAGL